MRTKTWIKSIITVFLMVLSAVILIACDTTPDGKTDAEILAEAKESLAITYTVSGDSANKVTGNIALPSKVGDVTVTWSSNNTSVISNAGIVVRPASDTNVELTATLTLNEATDNKKFNLKVVAVDAEDALDAITLQFAEGDSANSVTKDIVLPTSSMGRAITWTSTKEEVVSTSGAVTRPAYGQQNAVVTLTATIGDEFKSFQVTVLAITVKPDSLKLQEAYDTLVINTNDPKKADFALPATIGSDGVVITWTSSNTSAIKIENGKAVITRDADKDVVVVLTATFSIQGYDETLEKEFTVVVAQDEPWETEVELVNDGIEFALSKVNKEAIIRLNGVLVIAKSTEGFFVLDNEGTIFNVYTNTVEGDAWKDVEVGDMIDVIGSFRFTFGQWQIDSGSNNYRNSARVIESSADPLTLEPSATYTKVTDFIPQTEPTFTEDGDYLKPVYVTLTTKVIINKATQGSNTPGSYDVYLVDPDYDGVAPTFGGTTYKNYFVIPYYKTNASVLWAFDGQVITIDVLLYSFRDKGSSSGLVNGFTIGFFGTADDVQLNGSDEDIVNIVKASIGSYFDAAYVEETVVTAPTSLQGATISYASDNAEVDINGGEITLTPVDGQTKKIKITVTITKGDVTDTVDIEFDLGELLPTPLAQVHKLPDNTPVRVKGVIHNITISGSFQNGHIFIQDETAGLYLYRVAKDTLLTLNVGDEVIFDGIKKSYQNQAQLDAGATLISKVSSGNTVTPTVVTSASQLSDLRSQLVSVTGYLKNAIATLANGTNYTLVLEDGSEVALRTVAAGDSAASDLSKFADLNNKPGGTKLEIVTATEFFGSAGQLVLWNSSSLTVSTATAEEIADIALPKLVLPEESNTVTANITLPTTGLLGLTIEWTSNNAEVISNTGSVVRPEIGEDDVEVTLTYKVMFGEEVIAEGSLNFTVLAKEDEGGETPVEEVVMSLTLAKTGKTASSYSAFTYEDEKGTWSGSTNKTTNDNVPNVFGTNASNSITFTAATGYYIYSVQVVVGSASGNNRKVVVDYVNTETADATLVAAVSKENTPFTSNVLELVGQETDITIKSPDGALFYQSITVVVKPIA